MRRPLVLGDRPADLQEQLVLGVVGERPVGELDPAAVALEFLQEEDLVDVVARQPVGVGDQDAVELGQGGEVAEPVEAGAPQRGPGVAVVAEDVVLGELPSAVSGDVPQTVELLIDGSGSGPAVGSRPGRRSRFASAWSWFEGVGSAGRPAHSRSSCRRGPSAEGCRRGRDGCGARSTSGSWGSSRGEGGPGRLRDRRREGQRMFDRRGGR